MYIYIYDLFNWAQFLTQYSVKMESIIYNIEVQKMKDCISYISCSMLSTTYIILYKLADKLHELQ